ncbi:MAG: glucuronate isomerase [Clostridia bacterium]|nr:glucuronate isomerase [Clostridia bacterium]
MGIINDKFMFTNKTGKKLYFDYAKDLPIIDYHCHLSPKMIAEDYKFQDAYDLFLGGDHYKWRQMRSFGIDEKMITGDGDRYEKWLGFCQVMPYLIGNPLYHWTALELKRYFDIDKPLCPETAKEIWDKVNAKLKLDSFSAKNLILRSNVETICTTDDPADDLEYHKQIKEQGFKTKVLPTFRPDKAVNIDKDGFTEYIKANEIESYSDLENWLKERIAYFNDNGCKLSDHGLDYVPFVLGNPEEAFDKALKGETITKEEADVFKTAVIIICGKEYAKYDWTMQIHVGAIRNNNKKMFEKLGADTGFDSINDLCVAENLSKLLNTLEYENNLPKTILYTLNPKDNYVLGTMLGNFQSGPYKSKIQFGSGWWFNDNRDGMEAQMKALGNLGILGKFVGMLTDSRSFVSYPRHEYFRRIMCNIIGEWVENGEYPNDKKYLKEIVEGISYRNGKEYFNF